MQKFKPIEGVKFKEFDELGLPKDDGFDYYQYVTTDTNALDTFIEASPDQMEAAMHPKGERFDRDKEDNEMNDEEKAAFAALEDDDGVYDELEDDFMMIANEGQVAMEAVEEDEAEESKKQEGGILKKGTNGAIDMNEIDYRSRDVMILTAEGEEEELDEEEKALKEYRLAMAALLPTGGANFTAVPEGQDELDAGFDAFMDEEYDDDKIGELYEEDVMAKDKITQKVLEGACDEFIDETKKRFLDLAKDFGGERQ